MSAPRNRPRELEDPLNFYVYHPLARRLARLLVPTGISPNAVSVMSLAASCRRHLALYAASPGRPNALIGFAFMLLWHVVDGADGDLARMTGRASATGELVDGVCDYARQRHHVFRLRLPARRHARRLGLGARGCGRRQPHRPDQPCRDPAPPLSVAGLWRALAAQCAPAPRMRVFAQRKLVQPLFRLLGGRLCLAVRAR